VFGVPLFFLVSVYLFFLGQWSWSKYAGKLKRRVNTLLIPSLLESCHLGRFIQPVGEFSNGCIWRRVWRRRAGFLPRLYRRLLFGISARYSDRFQFWFIRDLIALVVLAPVIYFLLRRQSGCCHFYLFVRLMVCGGMAGSVAEHSAIQFPA